MKQRYPLPDSTWAQIEALYDWVDENYPEFWENAVLTPTQVSEANALLKRMGAPARNYYKSIHRWLEDPAWYSPHVDELAMERAYAFDWPVIRNLSLREWFVMIDHFARTQDFIEYEEVLHTPDERSFDYNRSPVYTAWLRGSDKERETLMVAVLRARRKMREA